MKKAGPLLHGLFWGWFSEENARACFLSVLNIHPRWMLLFVYYYIERATYI